LTNSCVFKNNQGNDPVPSVEVWMIWGQRKNFSLLEIILVICKKFPLMTLFYNKRRVFELLFWAKYHDNTKFEDKPEMNFCLLAKNSGNKLNKNFFFRNSSCWSGEEKLNLIKFNVFSDFCPNYFN